MSETTIFRWLRQGTNANLILIPASLAPLWEGVFGPTDGRIVEAKFRFSDPKAPATDYDLACDVEGYLGVVPVGSGQALIIADMPWSAFWYPHETEAAEGYLIRGVYNEEAVIRDRILPSLSFLPFEPDGIEFVFDAGPLYLFDSTLPGDDTEFEGEEDRIIIPLPGGRYTTETCYLDSKEDGVTLIIHHLRRIGDAS